MSASEFFGLWLTHLSRFVRRKRLEYRLKHIDSSLDILGENLINAFKAQKCLHQQRALAKSDLEQITINRRGGK